MIVAIILVLTAIALPPIGGVVRAMRLRSAVDAVKNQILMARIRAAANPNVHCGVYFDVAQARSMVFYDRGSGSEYSYEPTGDEVFGTPYELPSGITFSLPAANAFTNSAVVFRGDGSAKYGGSIEVKDADENTRILDVLASTGRVKVIVP
jgi:type II secretory pathway pseudopilin PulG